MKDKALKLALEALEMFCEHGAILRPIETRDAIKQALEQPELNLFREKAAMKFKPDDQTDVR